MNIPWLSNPCAKIDRTSALAASRRQDMLTKPPGSLGRLEDIAIRLSGMQRNATPKLDNVFIAVFVGDHGIASEGVSAYPQSVTAEMIRNFYRGGAAICVLAQSLNAKLEVINCGTACELENLEGVFDCRVASGTANFKMHPAMSRIELETALAIGRSAIKRAIKADAELFIAGEMGIANTTCASTLSCILLNLPASIMAGPGTGLSEIGIRHKISIIENAMATHRDQIRTPIDALQYFGGFEIAAMVGAYISAAQSGLPVLIDGFISAAAALIALKLSPEASNWFIYSHTSKEPGHAHIIAALKQEPLLNLGMRLGEGSGAAVTVPILRLACSLHNNMATFAEMALSEHSQ